MILNSDYKTAINFLNKLTDAANDISWAKDNFKFSANYHNQHQVLTALKILNQAVLEGSGEQKKELLKVRHKIVSLNAMLKNQSFQSNLSTKLGISITESDINIKGIQIALPKTQFEKMINIATRIPRVIFSLLSDLLILLPALGLTFAAYCNVNFNHKKEDIKVKKIPILLLHGSGFNETEWVIGRQFLKKKEYGSAFSLRLDGLLTNNPKKGIEDYAREIRAKVKEIKDLTGSERIILIGHSMGGMIAGYYAEHEAHKDDIKVDHVITISTPWKGAPLVDFSWKLGGPFAKDKETVRHQQMSVAGGTQADPNFRQKLLDKARESERLGLRKYYSLCSTTDHAVPGRQGCLTEDPRRQRFFKMLGHNGMVIAPKTWYQICEWLNEIYG